MTVLSERYELRRPLGSGGMARVFAAHDRVLDREVAVKVVHESLVGEPTGRRRLLREARAAAALHHPNTVEVFDTGEQGGRPFIVMELVEGRSLAERLRDEGTLTVADTVAVAEAMLSALGTAHERGLVHRDVKPSNILLPDAGGVKLADFGIATALAEAGELTATGQVLGTPRYLAPECAAGQPASPASDLYSLGAVLYECLAGRAPFDRETPIATALAHQSDPVPPLAERVPGLPGGLVAAVEGALAKDPAERFATAEEMWRALRSPAGHDRTAAVPPAAQTRVLGAQAPEPAAAAGRAPWLALAVVALVAVTAGLSYLLLTRDTDDGADVAQQEPQPAAEEEPAGVAPPGDEQAAGDGDGVEPGDEPPGSLDELIAEVALDPGALGEKGDDLLDDLRKVRGEPAPPKRVEESWKLIEEIAEQMADDELDRDAGAGAIEVLEAEARPDEAVLEPASELFAEVATTLPDWGEKGEDLLSELRELLGSNNHNQWSGRAHEIVRELDEWIDKGEIDPGRGSRALDVLRPLATEG